METKLDRMISSLDGLLPIMPHDPLITWPCEIRVSFTGGGSVRKRLSCQGQEQAVHEWHTSTYD